MSLQVYSRRYWIFTQTTRLRSQHKGSASAVAEPEQEAACLGTVEKKQNVERALLFHPPDKPRLLLDTTSCLHCFIADLGPVPGIVAVASGLHSSQAAYTIMPGNSSMEPLRACSGLYFSLIIDYETKLINFHSMRSSGRVNSTHFQTQSDLFRKLWSRPLLATENGTSVSH